MGDNSHHLILNSFADEFEETHDPVWVWHAIEFCSNWQRKTGEPLPYPGWVQDYLSIAAEMLLKLDDSKDDFADRITEIIGIRNNSITTSIQTIRDKVIFFEIQSLTSKGKELDEAISDIAKIFSLPLETVADIYRRFKR